MFNSLFRLVIPTVAFCTISGAALAQVSTCTFEKITSNGFSTDNKKRTLSSLGEAFKIDASKKLVQVQWPRGTSDWMSPDKISKNSRFTMYTILADIKTSDSDNAETMKVKYSYRLYADGTSARARAEPQGNPGAGWEWNDAEARYTCK